MTPRLLSFAAVVVLSGCPKAPGQLARPNDGTVTVISAGDISETTIGGQQLTAELVQAQRPDAVLVLGDLQYPKGHLEDFQRSYDPTWGRFKQLTWPVPGNHEYWGSEAEGYFTYFGERAGDPKKGYYSFELGQWHVIALNTNHRCEHVACDEDSEQVKWLEADLQANQKKCVLAYWHHPRFSSGAHGPFEQAGPFWRLFVKHQVELVLNGHEHFYERFDAVNEAGEPSSTGVVQFTVGTGGVAFSPFAKIHPASRARNNDTLGVVRLKLGPTSWESDFVGIAGSKFADHASGACR